MTPPSWTGVRSGVRRLLGAPTTEGLHWTLAPPIASPRLDANVAAIGDQLYIFGGYSTQESVLAEVRVFDLAREVWTDLIAMPAGVPESHLAIATDGERYIYTVAGQVGPRCRPAVPDAFVLDTRSRTWATLPPLPEARYAGTLQVWRGRLHFVGGAMPDRSTPAAQHWSLAIDGGRSVELTWRDEVPVPRGGGHRGSVLVGDALYVLGGQEGDFKPIPGDPEGSCDPMVPETIYGDVYRLADPDAAWERLQDMAVAASHIEGSMAVVGRKVVVVGGQHGQYPDTLLLILTDAVQGFDTQSGEWQVVGSLPCRLKNAVVGYRRGWLYAGVGQRDVGPEHPNPDEIIATMWKTRLAL